MCYCAWLLSNSQKLSHLPGNYCIICYAPITSILLVVLGFGSVESLSALLETVHNLTDFHDILFHCQADIPFLATCESATTWSIRNVLFDYSVIQCTCINVCRFVHSSIFLLLIKIARRNHSLPHEIRAGNNILERIRFLGDFHHSQFLHIYSKQLSNADRYIKTIGTYG